MKTQIHCILISLWLLANFATCYLGEPPTAAAQGTAFTYQGRLQDGATAANGSYDLRFGLYDSTNLPGVLIAGPLTNSGVAVSNGLFATTVDFGSAVFSGADRWLEIGARTNNTGDFATLSPRQQLTPAPYAISSANLMSPANAPLDITVNGQRVLQFEPTATSPNIVGGYGGNSVAPGLDAVVIAGGGRTNAANYAGAGLTFIGGGWANTNVGGGAFLGGGFLNRIEDGAFDAVLAGGRENLIQSNAARTTISGGWGNTISNGAIYGSIGGGGLNAAGNVSARVGGGFQNIAMNTDSTVAGGYLNTAAGYRSTVSGGTGNLAAGDYSIIAGGGGNTNAGFAATIGGGSINAIPGSADRATIAGGGENAILADSRYASIGGGEGNVILPSAPCATIPGGFSNSAASFALAAGSHAKAVFPGSFVWADSQNADFSSSGNDTFSVRAAGGTRFVTGGAGMTLDGLPVLAGTVGASSVNAASFSNTFWKVDGNAGTTAGTHFLGTTDNQPLEIKVAGERVFRLERPNVAAPNVVGGSFANGVGAGVNAATIAGGGNYGTPNSILDSGGAVGGGRGNQVGLGGLFSTIAGGDGNTNSGPDAVIGGGGRNVVGVGGAFAAIGGGNANTNTGQYATIPGGSQNVAAGDYSFAAGQRAKASFIGSFVWADSQSADLASTSPNQFLIRAAGGVGVGVTNPAHTMDVGGRIRLRQETGGNTAGLWLYQNAPANDRAFVGMDGDGYVGLWGNLGGNWAFIMNVTNGNVGIATSNPTNKLQVVTAYCTGTTWVNNSDRNLKQDFAAVDAGNLLEKIAAMPIGSWSYKSQPAEKHIGPTAQDFYAAFGLGDGDRAISTVDEGGVALAAIQGLNRKVEVRSQELEDRSRKLEAENAELNRINQLLEKRLEALERILRQQEFNDRI